MTFVAGTVGAVAQGTSRSYPKFLSILYQIGQRIRAAKEICTMKRLIFPPVFTLAVLSACSPAADAPKASGAPPAESQAPDVAAAAAAGQDDPRIPTVDPATITEASSVGDVMHAYVIPGSETLFAAESDDPPTDDAGWAKLRNATADVIKGCELLQAPSRSKGEAWNKTCDTVVAATRKTAESLEGKTTDELVFTDGDMMTGCTSCHQQFRDQKPPEGHLIGDKPI